MLLSTTAFKRSEMGLTVSDDEGLVSGGNRIGNKVFGFLKNLKGRIRLQGRITR